MPLRRPRSPSRRRRSSREVAAIAAKYECLIARAGRRARSRRRCIVTTFLIGPDGKEAGRYRKTHLTAEERAWAKAGNEYPVFDTPFGRIGVMSGYDAVFPETSRCLAISAADIILWPASLREPFERELLAMPRAEDNRVAVVLANRVDSPYPGGSVVIPPGGFPLWDINIVAPRVLQARRGDAEAHRSRRLPPEADDPEGRHVRQSPDADVGRWSSSSARAEAAE